MFFILIYLRDIDINNYRKISERNFKIQELINIIEELFSKYVNEENERAFLYTESLLILFYYNYCLELDYNVRIINQDAEGAEKVNFESVYNKNTILSFLQDFRRQNYSGLKLNHILYKIELVEGIII